MHRLEFLINNMKDGRVLDVGNLAKSGKVHKMLIEKFPSSEIHGIDHVDQNKLGIRFPNQKIGILETADYPENYFDLIYIGEVIEHTWEPKKMIDSCYKILKVGGRIVLDTPNIYSMSRMIRYFFTGKDIILGDPEHKIFFSRAMLENILESSGFRIIDLKSEVNFDTKRLKFSLPNFGSFKFMGECLLVCAEKIK